MDIRHSGTDRAQQSFEQKQRALIDQNRAFLRAARENLASIARAPLSLAERVRCAVVYLSVYATRRARVWLGSWRRRWAGESAPNRLHPRESDGKSR